ncbi:MAG: hypothetical protein ACLQVJ_19195 [Syntrophobacteraceae bacterium]
MKKILFLISLCVVLAGSLEALGQGWEQPSGPSATEMTQALGYTPLNPANNLSDVSTPATALGNLGGAAAANPTTAATKLSNTAPLGTALSLQGNPFVTGLTGWTDSGSQWSFSSGAAAHATGASADTLTSGTALVSGQPYLLTYTVTQTSGAGVVASFGGVSDSTRSTTGTYTKYGTASATTALVFTPQAATAVFSVSAVTLQPVGPALTSCGTGPTVQQGSGNVAGYVALGSGSPTACTVTFAGGFTNTPACTITPVGSTAVSDALSALSNAAFTVKLSATDTGFTYHCIGLNE